MPRARFRVVVNGFRVLAETWDDVLEFDGKRDEVLVSVSVKEATRDGQIVFQSNPVSPVMGDVNNLSGRILAGTASALGGLKTGDTFPGPTPQVRSIPLAAGRDYPPFSVWEGVLEQGGNVVFVAPTIWEWDPGGNLFDGWLQWHQRTDAQFGQKAKEIFTKPWPATSWIFDAVSLGIQTAATMTGVGGPVGSSGTRPIGMQQDAGASGTFTFNPYVMTLTYETAKALVAHAELGIPGLITIHYPEHPYFRGDYALYVQVEEVEDGTADAWEHVGHANGVAGMTALGGKLYCATTASVLWMREPLAQDVNWTPIGHANGVVALASLDGKLYCATGDNGLHVREALPFDVVWNRIGHANGVVGLAGTDGHLYCATNQNELWMRDPLPHDINWTRIGHANQVTAMTATSGSLYCATQDGRLWRRSLDAHDVAWQAIGRAPVGSVSGLAIVDGHLWASTRDNRLWRKPIQE